MPSGVYERTAETRENIRRANLGKKFSPERLAAHRLAHNRPEVKLKRSVAAKGKKRTIEQREAQRVSQNRLEVRQKKSLSLKGRPTPLERRKKLHDSGLLWWANLRDKDPQEYQRRGLIHSKAGTDAWFRWRNNLSEEEKQRRDQEFVEAGRHIQIPTRPQLILKGWVDELLGISCELEYAIGLKSADIYIPHLTHEHPRGLVIECFGDYWHSEVYFPGKEEEDAERERHLRAQGYDVWTFWEKDILSGTAKKMLMIKLGLIAA